MRYGVSLMVSKFTYIVGHRELKTGHQDSSPTKHHQGDMSHYHSPPGWVHVGLASETLQPPGEQASHRHCSPSPSPTQRNLRKCYGMHYQSLACNKRVSLHWWLKFCRLVWQEKYNSVNEFPTDSELWVKILVKWHAAPQQAASYELSFKIQCITPLNLLTCWPLGD